jgi:signal transduction histidine kinase
VTDGLLERECRRAGELLLGVLDEGYRLQRDPALDPSAVLRDVCARERELCRPAGIALELEVDPRTARWGTGLSEAMLERVARNLIVNAREALLRQERPWERAGRIEVRWSFEAGPPARLLLSVRDDGPGLDQHEALRGNPTGQVELASSKGSGAGLPSIRELVESVGGTLRAACRSEGGAEFVVALTADPARR